MPHIDSRNFVQLGQPRSCLRPHDQHKDRQDAAKERFVKATEYRVGPRKKPKTEQQGRNRRAAQLVGKDTLQQAILHMRIGALLTLSRNFQLQFLCPLLDKSNCYLSLKSGDTDTMLAGLRNLTLDVVLTTQIPANSSTAQFAAYPVAQQVVGLHGVPARMDYPDLRSLLRNEQLILPSETVIRALSNYCGRMRCQSVRCRQRRRHGHGAFACTRRRSGGQGSHCCLGR